MIKVLTGLARLTVVLFKLMLALFVYWESLNSEYQPVAVAVSLAYFWWVWRIADTRWRRNVALVGLAAIAIGCACHTHSFQFHLEFDMHRQRQRAIFWAHVAYSYGYAGMIGMATGAILLAVADTGSLPFRRRSPRGTEETEQGRVWPPPPLRPG